MSVDKTNFMSVLVGQNRTYVKDIWHIICTRRLQRSSSVAYIRCSCQSAGALYVVNGNDEKKYICFGKRADINLEADILAAHKDSS